MFPLFFLLTCLPLAFACNLTWMPYNEAINHPNRLFFNTQRINENGLERCLITRKGSQLGSICVAGRDRWSYNEDKSSNDTTYVLSSTTHCRYVQLRQAIKKEEVANELRSAPPGALKVSTQCANGQIVDAYLGFSQNNTYTYYGLINYCNDRRLSFEDAQYEEYQYLTEVTFRTTLLNFDLKDLVVQGENKTLTREYCNALQDYATFEYLHEEKMNVSITTVIYDAKVDEINISKQILPYSSLFALHKLGMPLVDEKKAILMTTEDMDILKGEIKVTVQRSLLVPPNYGIKVVQKFLVVENRDAPISALVRLTSETISGLELANYIRSSGTGVIVVSSNDDYCDVRLFGRMTATTIAGYTVELQRFAPACASELSNPSNFIPNP